MGNPLEELLVDADALDLFRLAEALKPYASIDRRSGRLIFSRAYASLATRQKVLVCLVGQKAAHLLGTTGDDLLSPKEVEACTGLPGGTVRAKLAELKSDQLLVNDGRGKYRASTHRLAVAVDELLPEVRDIE